MFVFIVRASNFKQLLNFTNAIKKILFLITILVTVNFYAQNLGIGITNPT